MAGIYIHIPYCKVACHYCNFHFSTNTNTLQDFVKALLIEISLQKKYLSNRVYLKRTVNLKKKLIIDLIL
jgi:oxygen-independent coproporphyrinogen-3 oxidase